MVHHSAKYNSKNNLLEDKKIFSSKINETEKPFKDSLGYPPNPLNPPNPPNRLNPSNPPSLSNPPSPSHPPNPRFKDSQLCFVRGNVHTQTATLNVRLMSAGVWIEMPDARVVAEISKITIP